MTEVKKTPVMTWVNIAIGLALMLLFPMLPPIGTITPVGMKITGIFCNDWFLDYVLHSARKKCEEKGIQTEFYLQGYQKIGGHNEKLVKDIQGLLDSAMQKTKDELYLQVANVSGREIELIVEGCLQLGFKLGMFDNKKEEE